MRQLKLGVVLVVMVVGGALLAQGPQGQRRPGEGRTPEFPEPTITQYKPRTTLKVAEHPTPRAKFPVIDIHSHHPTPITPERYAQVMQGMEANNLQILVNLSGSSGDRLAQGLEAIRTSPWPDRMVLFANVDFNGAGGPGWGEKAAAQLEADIKAGARGLKIFKDLGLRARKADGTRLKVDDPVLAPIWEVCARLNVPVLIHTAEPQEFFEPIDYTNERWLELALFRDRRYPEGGGAPRFEELLGERDRMFANHPKTKFIAAHFAYRANDLQQAAELLDRLPNVYLEVGAILAELGRQPRAAHAFFVKYQDRILFGKDSFQPDEFPYFWRVFETNDEYFDYYRDYHAFWKLYGMGLPDDVLKKLYYKNALALVPGLNASAFPQ
ncbi:MAG: amidohydrolase family protein [Vicinamibacterales bacterium]|nr:amidohydrolase family protein [Vicinamibacterales bacterium]